MTKKAMIRLIKKMWTAAVARLFRLWAENKYMDNIGILAYGSLIDDPGNEIISATIKRIKTRTPFNVEFARSSRSRGGAPTLVPVQTGGSNVNAVILVLGGITEEEAKNRLYRREIDQVGTNTAYREPESPGQNTIVVETLENFECVKKVLYTRIASNINPLNSATLAQLAIKSAKDGDVLARERDGIHYLISAKKNGIKTLLSEEYEKEIVKLTKTRSLDEAINSFQS